MSDGRKGQAGNELSGERGAPTDALLDRAVAPSGVVTFLFTDVEGSTRRWEADAEGMRVARAAHDAVLRRTVQMGSTPKSWRLASMNATISCVGGRAPPRRN